MTFFESIKTVFTKYATFEGRASRPEFWWFELFNFLVSSALGALFPAAYTMQSMGGFNAATYSSAPVINLAGFWSIAVLLPSLAVTVRRLRDAGHDWRNIFWILLPVVGWIILIVRLTDPSVPEAVAAPAPAAAAKPATKPAPAKAAAPKTPTKPAK